MEQWNYTWDNSRNFEHPLSMQGYGFNSGMYQEAVVPQPYYQEECYEPLDLVPDESIPQWQIDLDERARESEERMAKNWKLFEELKAKMAANRLLQQNQGSTSLHSSQFSNSNSLFVHNDNDVHSFGVERENNIPLDHVVNNVHHKFTFKEDGNREEELVLPGIGLGDCDFVLSRSNKGVDKESRREENVPSGEQTLNQKCQPALEPRQKTADKKKKRKKKKQGLKSEVFDIFKGADVNFPLLDLISQVPVYAEFVRDLCVHKKKLQADDTFVLREEVSAIIQRRVSPDIHDPTSFVIGCTIGEQLFKGALMDIGTSINIMPLATFRKLEISPLKPTSISVQLADGTFRMPVGIVEDVLVRVDKFILPADFVILDLDEDPKTKSRLPIILGRPFMAIAGAKINVQKGTVKLKVLGEKIKLQVLLPSFPQNVINDVLSKDLVKGNQAKSERIFDPLNPPKPLIQDHPLPMIAEYVQQEPTCTEDYFDEFDAIFDEVYEPDDKAFAIPASESKPGRSIANLSAHKTEVLSACVPPSLDMDPHFTDPKISSFRQVHELNEYASPPKHEFVHHVPTIHERDRGILPTPYIPPHRRMFMPTPYFHPHGYRLSSTHPNLESFESFKLRSPQCSEVQLEAIQCLREILGIGENRMKMHEWSPFPSYNSMAAPYMNHLGGRQMCYAPP